jgi:phospholipid/cholesterol/gamma-HCH transport system substrate-binding protein
MSVSLLAVIKNAKSGNGAVGAIIANDTLANNLKAAVANINAASKESVAVLAKLDSIASVTHRSIENGNGVVHALLKDPAMVKSVNTSLNNVEKGTVAFEESMQALKNNFLFRGYFRKVEKRKNKVRKSVTDTTHK